MVAVTIVAVFMYLHLTEVEFVQSVLGTNLVAIASSLVIMSGCLLFLLAIIGFAGACADKIAVLAVVSQRRCIQFYFYINLCAIAYNYDLRVYCFRGGVLIG